MLFSVLGTPFTRNVCYLRRKYKLSQKEMARRMGISVYYYRERFEKRRQLDGAVFDAEELHKLCEIFMKTPFDLIELDLEELDANKKGVLQNANFKKSPSLKV